MNPQLKQQIDQLKARYDALAPNERMIVAGLAALLVAVLIYSIALTPLYKVVNERSSRVTQKQQDLAWMQSMAPQLRALGNTRPTINTNESLVVIIASTAGRANIASSLAGQTPTGNNSVRVRLEGVQFDSLVNWLGILHAEFNIAIESADINHSAQPGQVNASLTLTRAAS